MIFHPTKGPVNYLLMTICGIEQKNLPNWFSGNLIMLTLILFSVWKYMGYYMVIYLCRTAGNLVGIIRGGKPRRGDDLAEI